MTAAHCLEPWLASALGRHSCASDTSPGTVTL